MTVPNPESWFAMTFGPEIGAKLAAIYPDSFKKSEDSQVQYFIFHGEPGGRITAASVPGEPSQKTYELQMHFKEAMRKSLRTPTQFFRVDCRWISQRDGSSHLRPLGYVTLIDGAYRIVSERVLHGLPGNPMGRIRVGGNVAAARLLDKVQPEYPETAKKSHVPGTVRLSAIIAPDGSVDSLEVISGDAVLASAAVDAVKQWLYNPPC